VAASRSRIAARVLLAWLCLAACAPAQADEVDDGATSIPIPDPPAGLPQTGLLSYYAESFHGRLTASGEIFDKDALTAAHRSLPFHTRVKITNLENGRSVIVRINDRGPFLAERIVDVSPAAARELGLVERGLARGQLSLVD
jgi:rare lipoprotein A